MSHRGRPTGRQSREREAADSHADTGNKKPKTDGDEPEKKESFFAKRRRLIAEKRCFDCEQQGHMQGAPECPKAKFSENDESNNVS